MAEDLDNVGSASLTSSLSEILSAGGALSPERDRVVALHSEGAGANSRASMLIEGIEYSRASIMFEGVEYAPNLRGLNVAVVNPSGKILCRGVFHTHRRSDGVLNRFAYPIRDHKKRPMKCLVLAMDLGVRLRKSESINGKGSRADTLFTTHAHSPLHRKCLQPTAHLFARRDYSCDPTTSLHQPGILDHRNLLGIKGDRS